MGGRHWAGIQHEAVQSRLPYTRPQRRNQKKHHSHEWFLRAFCAAPAPDPKAGGAGGAGGAQYAWALDCGVLVARSYAWRESAGLRFPSYIMPCTAVLLTGWRSFWPSDAWGGWWSTWTATPKLWDARRRCGSWTTSSRHRGMALTLGIGHRARSARSARLTPTCTHAARRVQGARPRRPPLRAGCGPCNVASLSRSTLTRSPRSRCWATCPACTGHVCARCPIYIPIMWPVLISGP
jgi:hypothetical protein